MAEAELARFIDRWTMEYVRVYPHPIDVAGAYHAGVAIHQRMAREGGETSRSTGVRTVSLNVDYLKPLTAESYTATTTIPHAGSSIVRVRAECVDDRGDLVAAASLNFSY